MKNNKIKICILELLLIIILFFALFASNIITRSILSIIMFFYMLVVYHLLKKRNIASLYKKQATLLMFIFSGIYLGTFYLMGLYYGYVQSKVLFSTWTFSTFIIPLTLIIVSAEIIRNVFLAQNFVLEVKNKKLNVSLIMTFISMVLVDLVIYTGIYNLTNLDNFLTMIGFVLFASLSCNLLYNYITVRFGCVGIIIYRLITTLFVYIIPITPDVYLFFRTFLRMLYPYLIYIVLEKFYASHEFVVAYKEKQKNFIWNTVLIVIATLFIMLISCQFRYGILVVGSESMTGAINMGDAVVFESYEGQLLQTGQIILFDYNGIQTVHRIVEIKKINGKVRYYTKGDANKDMDNNYTTEEEIQGIVKLKVKYIGYPTIWLRSLF